MGEEGCRHSFKGQKNGRTQKGNWGPKGYSFKMGEIGGYLYTEESDSVEMEKVIS